MSGFLRWIGDNKWDVNYRNHLKITQGSEKTKRKSGTPPVRALWGRIQFYIIHGLSLWGVNNLITFIKGFDFVTCEGEWRRLEESTKRKLRLMKDGRHRGLQREGFCTSSQKWNKGSWVCWQIFLPDQNFSMLKWRKEEMLKFNFKFATLFSNHTSLLLGSCSHIPWALSDQKMRPLAIHTFKGAAGKYGWKVEKGKGLRGNRRPEMVIYFMCCLVQECHICAVRREGGVRTKFEVHMERENTEAAEGESVPQSD